MSRAETRETRDERTRRFFSSLVSRLSFVVLLACGDATLEPLPLEVTVQASRATAAPADTIFFTSTAQGGTLIGLEADYGDGTGDIFAASGARTARTTFRHAYTTRGTYDVRITVTDGAAGQKTASVSVRIQ